MFELYPRLKCTVFECGANWISAWLDRLDHKYEPLAGRTVLKMKPSEYFYRRCLVSADLDRADLMRPPCPSGERDSVREVW